MRKSLRSLIGFLLIVIACGCIDESENGENGTSGRDSLIRTTETSAGVNCSYGGTRIDVGPDLNSNGELDTEEITDTTYLCSDRATTFNGLVYVADKNYDGMNELFMVTSDGSSELKLAGPKSVQGKVESAYPIISPDRKMVAYTLINKDSVKELYVASLVENRLPVKVSGELPTGGDVWNCS